MSSLNATMVIVGGSGVAVLRVSSFLVGIGDAALLVLFEPIVKVPDAVCRASSWLCDAA